MGKKDRSSSSALKKAPREAWGLESRALSPAFLLRHPVPHTGHGEAVRTPALEAHFLDQSFAVLGNAVTLLEGETILVPITAHDQSLVGPTAGRRRCLARRRQRRIAVRRFAAMARDLFGVAGLTNPVSAVRGECDHTAHLFDLELLAWEAQSLSQCADGRGCGRYQGRSAQTLRPSASSSSAAPAWVTAIPGGLAVGCLQQVHGVVAIGRVQLPMAAEIHAGRRHQA